ncbi:MAG: hypothetical protein BWX47_01933 [candidate division Hyd24-12 bacterium ADurb.Bin004]|nr:MAG: hypothetical protein BWX47_01933 [candidate division Hyd24-12 bacterium ADurb.Bin004]
MRHHRRGDLRHGCRRRSDPLGFELGLSRRSRSRQLPLPRLFAGRIDLGGHLGRRDRHVPARRAQGPLRSARGPADRPEDQGHPPRFLDLRRDDRGTLDHGVRLLPDLDRTQHRQGPSGRQCNQSDLIGLGAFRGNRVGDRDAQGGWIPRKPLLVGRLPRNGRQEAERAGMVLRHSLGGRRGWTLLPSAGRRGLDEGRIFPVREGLLHSLRRNQPRGRFGVVVGRPRGRRVVLQERLGRPGREGRRLRPRRPRLRGSHLRTGRGRHGNGRRRPVGRMVQSHDPAGHPLVFRPLGLSG